MAEEKKQQSVIEEAGLPDNWQVVDSTPIVPGQSSVPAPPASNPMPYFKGTLSPSLQHDSYFTGTEVGSPRIPSTPLMPMGPSGNAQGNSATQSVINSQKTSTASSTSGMNFKGTWLAYANYVIGDVVLFNIAAYVATQANSGQQPDLAVNTTVWTLLSENFKFNATTLVHGTTGVGTFDKNSRNQGQNVFPATSAPTAMATPSEQKGWAILVSSVSEGAPGVPGWADVGSAIGFSAEGLYMKTFITNATVSYSGSPAVRWCTNLSLFQGNGESITGTVTSVQVDGSNHVTVQVVNNWPVGTHVKFSGLTGANFLNGQTIQITSRSNASITGNFTHAAYGPTADSGNAAYLPYIQVVSVPTSNGTHMVTLPNAVTKGNTILIAYSANDVNATGNIASVSDGSSTYTILNEPNGGAGSFANMAFAQNVAGGTPTFSVGVSGSNTSIASTMFVIEVPGTASGDFGQYLPFDVEEFRGSFFVCNTETVLDAFADPTSWWQIAQGTGYVIPLTGNYPPVASDYGRLIQNSSSSNYTVTLPSPPPSNSWWIALENSGTGSILINTNSLTLDGSAAGFTLTQNQGILIFSDGNNYWSFRGFVPTGGQWNMVARSATYTAGFGDYVYCDTTAGGFTINLPVSATGPGRAIRIKKISSDSNAVLIAPNSIAGDTIDNSGAQTNITIKNNEMELVADGVTHWWIS